jgi:hypothetical protein
VIIETNCLDDPFECSTQGLLLFSGSVSQQKSPQDKVTCTFDSQELLDIEEDFNWMKAGLNLVESRLVILTFRWEPV